MRRLILTCLAAALAFAARANTITVTGGAGHPGDEVTVSVAMSGTDAVTALELQLPLGEWLSYVDGSCALSAERSDGHSVMAASLSPDPSPVGRGTVLRIYAYSLALKPFKGTEGTLLTFKLRLGNAPGDMPLTPTAMLSDATGTQQSCTVEGGTATIQCPALRVLTEQIDFGHVPIRSTYEGSLTLENYGNEPLTVSNIVPNDTELSMPQTALTIPAGSSSSVSVVYSPLKRVPFEATLTIESNAVNGKIYNRWQTAKVVADPFSVNELHVQGAQGASDTEVEIALRMNNMEPIVGVQVSFRLPDALKYVEGSAAMTARSDSHTILANVEDGNRLTLLLYSSENKPLRDDDGAFATFRLSLQGESGWYWLEPEDVILGNAAMENMTSATSGAGVEIYSPTIVGSGKFDFGSQDITKPIAAVYNVENQGQAQLVIDKVTFLSDGYQVATPLPLTIAQGESGSIEVGYTATKAGAFSTTMNVYSNDPKARMKTVAVSGYAFAPNELTLSGAYEGANEDFGLGVALTNASEITAVEFNIAVDNPSQVGSPVITSTARLSGHSANIYNVGEGVWKVLIFSMTNTAISGNEGELLHVVFPRTGDKEDDNVTFRLTSVMLSSKDGRNMLSPVVETAQEHRFKTIIAEEVRLSATKITLNVGDTRQLTAEVLPEGDYDKTVVWTSSNEAVATVDATGLVTAISAEPENTAVITAACKSITATCTVTVVDPTSISPDNDGNLPMGVDEPWTGKVLFNSEGGYGWNGIHDWSPLYEALPGDAYTIALPTPTYDYYNGRVQFKTPITIDASHRYTLRLTLKATNAADVNVRLLENEDDGVVLLDRYETLGAYATRELSYTNLSGVGINDMMIELMIKTTADDTDVTVSGISLFDQTEQAELWVGTSYYNWCGYYYEWGGRMTDMEISGRTVTDSWTEADFDDSMWSEVVMPIGDSAMSPNTLWPGDNNTNYWIRRDFLLYEAKPSTTYTLRVCHDDTYWIYVNGHLVDSYDGWTDGKNPIEINVPSEYLQVGKNVIATYIRQNWGGKYFDCGLVATPGVEALPGDTNDDGVVDITDYVNLIDYINYGIRPGVTFNSRNADVNSDDAIDIADAVGIIEIINNVRH